eukprot:1157418-Pelagomonas_calceolata.AAC.5
MPPGWPEGLGTAVCLQIACRQMTRCYDKLQAIRLAHVFKVGRSLLWSLSCMTSPSALELAPHQA